MTTLSELHDLLEKPVPFTLTLPKTQVRALLEVAEAARRHRNCVFEQADRAARNSDAAMVCRHVKWNGGPAEESCAKLLWNAVAVLDSPNVKEGG